MMKVVHNFHELSAAFGQLSKNAKSRIIRNTMSDIAHRGEGPTRDTLAHLGGWGAAPGSVRGYMTSALNSEIKASQAKYDKIDSFGLQWARKSKPTAVRARPWRYGGVYNNAFIINGKAYHRKDGKLRRIYGPNLAREYEREMFGIGTGYGKTLENRYRMIFEERANHHVRVEVNRAKAAHGL